MTASITVSNFNSTFIEQLNANFAAIDAAIDAVDAFAIGVGSLAALKALPVGAQTGIVHSEYRSTAGDGGGGRWVWRSGNQSANVSADAQSGLWAAPDTDSTGASGAFQRQYSGAVDVRWFGATGDGTTDDATALQAAFDSGARFVFFPRPSSVYLIKSALTVGNGTWSGGAATAAATLQNITLVGESGHGGTTALDGGASSIRIKADATAFNAGGTMLTVNGPGSFSIKNLHLDCNGKASLGLLLKHVYRSRFENLTITDFNGTGLQHLPSPTLPSGFYYGASANAFVNVTVRSTGYSVNTIGLDIGLSDCTSGSNDVNRDTWTNCEVEVADVATSFACVLRLADAITFINPFFHSPGQRRAKSIKVIPATGSSVGAYFPQTITFINANLVGEIVTPTDGSWTPNGTGNDNMDSGLFFAPLNTGDMMAPGYSGRSGLPSNPYGGIHGFTTDGRTLGMEPNAQTGTSYTVVSNDKNKLVTLSNTSAVAVTLPEPTAYNGFGPNFATYLVNLNTGAVTITPTSANINGASSMVLLKGQAVYVVSDGTDYIAMPIGAQPPLQFAAVSSSSAVANTASETVLTTYSSIQANTLQVGSLIKIRAAGKLSRAVSASLSLVLKIGGTSVCYGTNNFSATRTDYSWSFEADVIVRSLGSSGTMTVGPGYIGVFGQAMTPIASNTPGGTFTLNTTTAAAVALYAQWASADPGDSVTLSAMTVEVLNPMTTA